MTKRGAKFDSLWPLMAPLYQQATQRTNTNSRGSPKCVGFVVDFPVWPQQTNQPIQAPWLGCLGNWPKIDFSRLGPSRKFLPRHWTVKFLPLLPEGGLAFDLKWPIFFANFLDGSACGLGVLIQSMAIGGSIPPIGKAVFLRLKRVKNEVGVKVGLKVKNGEFE